MKYCMCVSLLIYKLLLTKATRIWATGKRINNRHKNLDNGNRTSPLLIIIASYVNVRMKRNGAVACHRRSISNRYHDCLFFNPSYCPCNMCYLIKVTLNTTSPVQNGRHFAEVVFKCILSNRNFHVHFASNFTEICWSPVGNKSPLVPVIASRGLFYTRPYWV